MKFVQIDKESWVNVDQIRKIERGAFTSSHQPANNSIVVWTGDGDDDYVSVDPEYESGFFAALDIPRPRTPEP